MRRLLFLCLLVIVLPSGLYAQFKTDSLRQAIRHAVVDSVKVTLLQRLFLEYQKDSIHIAEATIQKAIRISDKLKNRRSLVSSYNLYADFLRIQSRNDSALRVSNKSFKIAEDTGYLEGQSDAILLMAGIYWQKGNFDKTQEFIEQNIILSKKLKDSTRLSRSYNIIAAVHSQLGEYTTAMTYYTDASKMFYAMGQIKGYAMTLGNIGWIQRSLENNSSAIEYFKKADSIYSEINDPSGQSFTAYNLAVLYKDNGQLDKALELNEKGLQGYQQLGIKKRVSYCYFNLAEIYRLKEEYNVALDNYFNSLELSLAVDDSVQIGYSKLAIARIMLELGQKKGALEFLVDAGKVSKRMDLDILAMDVHKELSALYEAEGKMGEALNEQKKYSALKDTLYTREKRELGTEIEAKYQNEQKAKEIDLLAKDNDLQTLKLNKRINERNSIIAFALLMMVLAGLLYNQYRIKQKGNSKLKELDRLKSNFFANISHEFRTPLTLIKGPIDQLVQNPDQQLNPAKVEMIQRNTDKVLQLVNQLLDLSKLDSGNLKVEQTEGDIFQCLRAAASSFESHAIDRNIDYNLTIPSSIFWTSFDKDKVEKIVYNLISNAFKFSVSGAKISVEASHNDHSIEIVIMDTGKGIEASKLPFIFDRFYQVDQGQSNGYTGTGIGLSLSKELIELMSGSIEVDSSLNVGTTFKLKLPLQKIYDKIDSTKQRATKRKNPLGAALLSKTVEMDHRKLPVVLLVEDNSDMRQYIRDILIKYYKVHEATNGTRGFKYALANPPDLIITDLMMPKMDGIQLCQSIKNNIITSHIPVVMLTAKVGMENKIQGLKTGADDYLTKPFEPGELLIRSKNLIEQRRKLRERFSKITTQIDPQQITVNSMDQNFLEKVLKLLENKYMDPEFGVPQMQKEMAMSRAQYHRKIKSLTNETPGALLRNFRLKRAAQLLSQKADSVSQIAYGVGFNSLSYFARCFKELYGVSPSSF